MRIGDPRPVPPSLKAFKAICIYTLSFYPFLVWIASPRVYYA